MTDLIFTITWNRRPSLGGSVLVESGEDKDSLGFKNLGNDEERESLVMKVADRFELMTEQVEELRSYLLESVRAHVSHDDDDNDGDGSRPSKAELGVKLVNETVLELFHDEDREAYADVDIDGCRETLEIRSRTFREWVGERYYTKHRKPLGATARADVIDTVAAQAKFDGPTEKVYLRVARLENEVWIDLGSPGYVKVTSDGWTVEAESPVKFRRPEGFLPMALPERGGDIDELRSLINIERRDFVLIVGCLVTWLADPGPHVVLVLQGGDGCGKTSLGMILRKLVDPATLTLRGQPKNEEDLVIAARNSALVAFDNFSHVPEWLSDGMCRMTHGIGFGTRTLYTNRDETIFHGRRPLLLTGIPALATRPDLMSRAIVLHLPAIADEDRAEEADVISDFDDAHARILGCLLDGVAAGLRNREKIKLDPLPRMADFAQFAHASEEAFGWHSGTFAKTYTDARDTLIGEELAQEPVIDAVLKILDLEDLPSGLHDTEGGVEGSPTAWFEALDKRASDSVKRSRRWPKDGRGLSNKLNRFANVLRSEGIEVIRDRTRQRRSIEIRKLQ